MPGGSVFQRIGGILGEGFYMCRFQEPGRAEKDFEKIGARGIMSRFLFPDPGTKVVASKDKELMESTPMLEKQPSWITEFDIQYYTEDKEKSGWSGSLNYYRCLDKTYELKAPWAGLGLPGTKNLFIAGKHDLVLKFPGMQEFVDKHLKGGHFIQQEQPTQINELLIAYFKEQAAPSFSPST